MNINFIKDILEGKINSYKVMLDNGQIDVLEYTHKQEALQEALNTIRDFCMRYKQLSES